MLDCALGHLLSASHVNNFILKLSISRLKRGLILIAILDTDQVVGIKSSENLIAANSFQHSPRLMGEEIDSSIQRSVTHNLK